jgi:hypothetical protein
MISLLPFDLYRPISTNNLFLGWFFVKKNGDTTPLPDGGGSGGGASESGLFLGGVTGEYLHDFELK